MSTKIPILLLLLAVWSAQASESESDPGMKHSNLDNSPGPRIVGGSLAPPGAVKFLVSLRYTKNDVHFCGGNIIGDRWILTAANCINNMKTNELVAVAGTVSRARGCPGYKIDKFFIHPKYSEKPRQDDIALMRTEKAIEYSDRVGAISLPFAKTQFGETGSFAGFGLVDQDAKGYQDPLRWMKTQITSMDQCRNNYYKGNVDFPITENQLCTLTNGKNGACDGDMGGGLELDNEVIGVLSWVTRCARGKPDVFTRVFNYKDWIKKTMTDNKP